MEAAADCCGGIQRACAKPIFWPGRPEALQRLDSSQRTDLAAAACADNRSILCQSTRSAKQILLVSVKPGQGAFPLTRCQRSIAAWQHPGDQTRAGGKTDPQAIPCWAGDRWLKQPFLNQVSPDPTARAPDQWVCRRQALRTTLRYPSAPTTLTASPSRHAGRRRLPRSGSPGSQKPSARLKKWLAARACR